MNFTPLEGIIRTMLEEFTHTKPASQTVVILKWRKILGEGPYSLKEFQIDEVVREVHKRIRTTAR